MRAIERGRVVVRDRVAAPLREVTEDVGVERAAPGDAAFEEGKAQLGEAPGYAAEEERARDGLVAGGEVADVVRDVIGGGVAAPEADARNIYK